MLQKGVKLAVLTLLSYLLQATVAQYLSIADVAPNLALALIAVVTVAMGRKYAFLMSLAVGYLLEIMLAPLDYISLILYPVAAMLGALVFADKSERKLEEERSLGKKGGNWPAHLRTPLCALMSAAVYEAIHLLYIYLTGVALDSGHYGRALLSVFYSAALAGLLQFPIRWWLGVYKLKKAR